MSKISNLSKHTLPNDASLCYFLEQNGSDAPENWVEFMDVPSQMLTVFVSQHMQLPQIQEDNVQTKPSIVQALLKLFFLQMRSLVGKDSEIYSRAIRAYAEAGGNFPGSLFEIFSIDKQNNILKMKCNDASQSLLQKPMLTHSACNVNDDCPETIMEQGESESRSEAEEDEGQGDDKEGCVAKNCEISRNPQSGTHREVDSR